MSESPHRDQARESPTTDPEHVHELFVAGRALPAPERRRMLDAACQGDAALRNEVESLLAHDATAEGFLAAPIWQALAECTSPALTVGQRLGPFVIESFLDRGGSGCVYVARDERDQQRVALKVFADRHALQGERGMGARMLKEVAAAAAIRHPHVVEVLDCGVVDERTYCAMRLVEGPSLRTVLEDMVARGRRPDASERRALLQRCAEVADGLAALHRVGLVHRDVKPANIVLEASKAEASPTDYLLGSAVLVDFGMTTRTGAADPASTLWLSLDYAAPEQMLGHAVGPTADVFALGVTLHDLLAARAPADRGRAAAGKLEPLRDLAPEVDPAVAAVVAMATDIEPNWRYKDAGALHADLDAALCGKRVAATRIPRVVRLGRHALRQPRRTLRALRRLAWVACIGLVLVLATQQGIAVWRSQRAVTAAWATGDLATWSRELSTAPAFAATFFPTAVRALHPFDDQIDRPEHDRSQAALRRVLATGVRDDWDDALALAVRYLQRDGMPAHPILARFHALALTQTPDGAPLGWTVRLLFERPAVVAADAAACAPVRAVLTAMLTSNPAPATAMDVVVALAGCPDDATIATLLAFGQRLAHGSISTPKAADHLECERVLVRAAATILRQLAWARGGRRKVSATQSRDLFELSQRLLADAEATAAARDRAATAVLALALEVGLAERTIGHRFAEAWDALLSGAPALALRAARGDPGLRAQMLSEAPPPALASLADVGPDATLAKRCQHAMDLGFVAGLLDDATCTEALRRHALADPRQIAVCEQAFDARLRQARGLARGTDAGHEPDADSCLSADLDEPPADLEIAAQTDALPEKTLALWDFCRDPARVAAASMRLRAVAAAFGRDEIVPDATYLRLHRAGTSSITLPFVVRPVSSGNLRLRIAAQKGVRAALPYDGQAALDILLDGTLVAQAIRVVTSATAEIELPLCPATRHEHRQLSLRLSGSSTTTLRIYRVSLLP